MEKEVPQTIPQNLPSLLQPYTMKGLPLKNRIVMSALARMRCDRTTCVPSDMHVKYYSDRADAGFIITECSQVSPHSSTYPGTPGIYSDEQVEGWKRVTDAVHKAGGRIFLQIWHGGRSVHSSFGKGLQPLAPSSIAIRGKVYSENGNGTTLHEAPREMTKEDIKNVLEEFRKGAENAKKAGFDGVELHGANGYIVDEFLRSGANKRTDEYGGSVENRCRFALEVIDQLTSVFGPERTGIRVSPVGRYQDMYDENPLETYTYLFQQLSKKGIAFIEALEAWDEKVNDLPSPFSQLPEVCKSLRPHFNGTLIANWNLEYNSGNKYIESGKADLVSFGRMFVANSDLVRRFREGWPLNEPIPETFFTPGEKGYLDYPTIEESFLGGNKQQ